jgi:hypothetical protein
MTIVTTSPPAVRNHEHVSCAAALARVVSFVTLAMVADMWLTRGADLSWKQRLGFDLNPRASATLQRLHVEQGGSCSAAGAGAGGGGAGGGGGGGMGDIIDITATVRAELPVWLSHTGLGAGHRTEVGLAVLVTTVFC